MLRTFAAVILAVFLLGASDPPAPAGGEPQSESKPDAAEKHNNPQPDQNAAPNAPLLQVQQQSTRDHSVTAEAKRESEWYANPDWWVAGFTCGLVIVTGGLWTFTWLLWASTKRLVGDAENTAQHQLRAYITVDSHGVRPFIPGGVSVAHIGVRNVGQIPARDVRWFIDADISRDGKLQEFPITLEFYGENLTIQPHAEMVRSQSVEISPNAFSAIRSGAAFLYVWGRINYTDGFGNSRFTLFCHRYEGHGIRRPDPNDVTGTDGHQFIIAESMRYHQYGNDAD